MTLDIFTAVNSTAYTGYRDTNATVANAIAQSLRKADVSTKEQVTAFGSILARFLNESLLTTQLFEESQILTHALQVLDAALSAGLVPSFEDIFVQVSYSYCHVSSSCMVSSNMMHSCLGHNGDRCMHSSQHVHGTFLDTLPTLLAFLETFSKHT